MFNYYYDYDDDDDDDDDDGYYYYYYYVVVVAAAAAAAAAVVVVVVVVTLVVVVKMSSSGRFLFVESQDHKTAIICVNSDSYIIIFLILALDLTYVFVSFDYQQPHYYVGDSGRCTRDDCGDGSTLSLPQETNKRPWVDSHTAR